MEMNAISTGPRGRHWTTLILATVGGIVEMVFGIIFATGGIQSKSKTNMKTSLLTPDTPPGSSRHDRYNISPEFNSRPRSGVGGLDVRIN